MSKYIVTSKKFTGELSFEYCPESGDILKFENNAAMSNIQLEALKKGIPTQEWMMEHWPWGVKTKVPDKPPEFSEFWEQYNFKKGKANAQLQWSKLKPEEKSKAVRKIRQYQMNCNSEKIKIIYPERYLKFKRFDDE